MSSLRVNNNKKSFTAFYSWQSDLDSKLNKNLISNCIDKAIKEIKKNKDSDINYDIGLDRDTKNVSGSPSIVDTIFQKISASDIFICDVTIINNSITAKRTKKRLTPNPNVLIELGYAVHVLGWERIICINNLNFGAPELLPFDIRGRRISNYNSNNIDPEIDLKSTIKLALISIINDYDNIIIRHSQNGFVNYDKKIYQKVKSICNEAILKAGVSLAINDLSINRYYYNIWGRLERFYEETENHFLDTELDSLYRVFVNKLNSFHVKCCKVFYRDESSSPTLTQMREKGVEVTEEIEREYEIGLTYSFQKRPQGKETWPDADIRMHQTQDELFNLGEEVLFAYHQLVLKAKVKLMT